MMAKAMSAAAAEAPAASAGGDSDRPAWLLDYDKVKAKAAAGGKLSGKDKKLLKRGQEREAGVGVGASKWGGCGAGGQARGAAALASGRHCALKARASGFGITRRA